MERSTDAAEIPQTLWDATHPTDPDSSKRSRGRTTRSTQLGKSYRQNSPHNLSLAWESLRGPSGMVRNTRRMGFARDFPIVHGSWSSRASVLGSVLQKVVLVNLIHEIWLTPEGHQYTISIGYPYPHKVHLRDAYAVEIQVIPFREDTPTLVYGEGPSDALLNALRVAHDQLPEIISLGSVLTCPQKETT
jgi:hypothetical protein